MIKFYNTHDFNITTCIFDRTIWIPIIIHTRVNEYQRNWKQGTYIRNQEKHHHHQGTFQGCAQYNSFQKPPSADALGDHFICVLLLNNIPHKVGAPYPYSLQNILTGTQIYFNNHCHAQFGTNKETHEDPYPTNTI